MMRTNVPSKREIQFRKHVLRALVILQEYLTKINVAESVEVRVRIRGESDCTVLWGDPGHDADHSGYWGASTIHQSTPAKQLGLIAINMVNEALDMEYDSQ